MTDQRSSTVTGEPCSQAVAELRLRPFTATLSELPALLGGYADALRSNIDANPQTVADYLDRAAAELAKLSGAPAQRTSITDSAIEAGARGIVDNLTAVDGGLPYDQMPEWSRDEARETSRACLSAAFPSTDGATPALSKHNEFNPEREYPGSYGPSPPTECGSGK